MVENLECLDGDKLNRQIRLQDIVDASNEMRVELLAILDFQKRAKQHLHSINGGDLERLIVVLRSILAGRK